VCVCVCVCVKKIISYNFKLSYIVHLLQELPLLANVEIKVGEVI